MIPYFVSFEALNVFYLKALAKSVLINSIPYKINQVYVILKVIYKGKY